MASVDAEDREAEVAEDRPRSEVDGAALTQQQKQRVAVRTAMTRLQVKIS